MSYAYALAPLGGWLAAGAIKFLVNSVRSRRLAFDQIGAGGMPSTHSAVVSAPAALIALREGIDTPAFSVALALAMVVIFDAAGLRRSVGAHAAALNQLIRANAANDAHTHHKERTGHSPLQIAAGLLVGTLAAIAAHHLL